MRTRLFVLSLPVFFSMVGTAGCGGSSAALQDAPAPADGGSHLDAAAPLADSGALDSAPSSDASAPDTVPPDDAGDAGPAAILDAGNAGDAADAANTVDAADAAPESLVAGSGFHVLAITSDNYVIYWGPSDAGATTNSVFAVPLAGGAPIAAAGPYTGHFSVNILGPDVFVWDLGSETATVGPLGVWTHAHGFVSLSSASVEDNAAVSDDGSTVAFVTNTTATQKDVAVAGSDGSNSTILVAGIYRASCPFDVAFAGGGVIVQFCTDPLPDGGVTGSLPPALSFFPTPSPSSRRDLLTLPADPNHYDWSLDSLGTLLYAPSSTGVGAAISLPAGTATTIDGSGAVEGILSSGGGTVLYRTTSGEIQRSPTAAPSQTTVVTSGAAGLIEISPDVGTVAYYETGGVDANGNFLSDLHVASAGSAGTSTSLVTSSTLLAEAFTLDSTYLTYSVTTSTDDLTATLQAAPVAGGAPIALGTDVFEWRMGAGAEVIFADNYAAATGATDIHAVNLAGTAAATLVAAAATNFRLTNDRAQIVYATDTAPAGLYAVPVP
jgi:hypothetical protein